MSQQTKPGRRTPLSLGPPKIDVNDKSNVRTGKATVSLEKLSADILMKQTKNGSSTEEKVDNNKTENGQNNAQNGSVTKKDSGSETSKEPSNENSKAAESPKPANDKVKLSNEKLKDEKIVSAKGCEKPTDKAKQLNEKATSVKDKPKSTNDKEENVSQNVSGKTKIEEQKADPKNNGEKEKEVRESVRQKQLREEKEKEENGKATLSTPEKNSDSAKVKDKRKSELVTPTKILTTAPSDSLLAEKSLKGFNENLEEADSMKMNDSPMPAKDLKVLKLSHGPPVRAIRRSEKLDDASLLVNLSTVSEQSNESTSNNTPVERNYSLRNITGRRSTRPLRETNFDFHMRESYHKIQNDFNDSTASTNVMHDSASPRDNFRSPLYATGRELKRNIDDENDESPKKSRFDFGLFDLVASPVTKLREKFSRANLSTSTPNKLIITEAADKTEDIPSGIDAENFMADEDMPNIDLNPLGEDIGKKSEMENNVGADDEAPIEIREPRNSRCAVM